LFLFFFVGVVALGNYGGVRVRLLVVIRIFRAVPETVAMVLVDGPAAVLVLIIVVRTLATSEATDIIGVVVVSKPQWLT
ncbi:MAG: hypothetical protein M3345_01570, partial [Actinomycetota bacterium]|nr:hypothetical protein [Actinomycetota bacterium]